MMKKLSLLLIGLIVMGFLNAQSIKRASINSGGLSGANLLFSVGQVAPFSGNAGDYNITIGFQQPVGIPLDTTLTIIGKTSFCEGDSVVFQLNTNPHIHWCLNNVVIDSSDKSSFAALKSGNYYAVVFDDFGNSDTTRTVQVTTTVSTEIFNPLPDTIRTQGSSYLLDATAGYTKYTWSNGDSTQTVTVFNSGKHKVSVTASLGCRLSDSTYLIMSDTIKIYIPDIIGSCVDTIEVPVRVNNFNYMLSAQMSISFLEDWLNYQGVSNYGPASLGLDQSNFNYPTSDRLSFAWNSSNLAPVDLPDSTILFTLKFTRIQGSPSRTVPIGVINTPVDIEFVDGDLQSRIFKTTNGSVLLNCNSDTIGLYIPTIKGTCSTTVDVPVKVVDFNNLIAMQGSINWNPLDLRFDTVVNVGPPQLSMDTRNFGTAQKSNGKLQFSWSSEDLVGVDLPDSTTLFTIRYTILANSVKTIPITITGDPAALEFINESLVEDSVRITNGSVVVECGAIVSGKVKTPLNNAVKGVTVSIIGNNETIKDTTDNNGDYSFSAVRDSAYIITPSKNNEVNRTNGVTTLDIALIQAHILSNQLFDAGYKVIAADVNSSGTISTIDILYTRRLILGIDTSFPGNRTWAFVDADHSFANILKPFPFPSSDTLVINNDTTKNFIAVKLGDVNYDRDTTKNSAYRYKLAPLEFYYDTVVVNTGAGSIVKVQIRSKKLQEVMGFQFTLNWDKSQLLFDSIANNVLGVFYGDRWKDEGMLSVSWNDPNAQRRNLKENELLFELVYKASSQLSRTSLKLSDDKIGREAFDGKYMLLGMQLDAAPIMKMNAIPEGLNSALRVYPNPAGRKFTVEYQSKTAGDGQLRLFDAGGKVIHEQEVKVKSGLNSYEVMLNSQPASSTYILQMVQGIDVKTSKVVISNK